MRIYLAGPQLAGINRITAAANVALVERTAALLRADSHDVYTHHEQDPTSGNARERLHLALTHLCLKTEAVIAVPGWRDSQQARAEITTALTLHMPVYDATEFLFVGEKAERLSN